MSLSPEQRADDLVISFQSKLAQPLSVLDAIALRSAIAQQIAQAIEEKARQ